MFLNQSHFRTQPTLQHRYLRLFLSVQLKTQDFFIALSCCYYFLCLAENFEQTISKLIEASFDLLSLGDMES